MSGGRRGDFSRFPFDPKKHWSAVLMQQGRVQLDSDWNAQVDILDHRLRTGAADLVGPAGGPAGNTGFEILPGYGLLFDGKDDHVVIGGRGVHTFSPAGEWTIEVWFTPQRGEGAIFSRSVRRGERDFFDEFFLTIEADRRVRFHREGFSAEDPATRDPLELGKRAHVALTCGEEGSRIYLNGRLAARESRGFPVQPGAEAILRLGSAFAGGKPLFPFSGLIHELRFWGTGRTADDLLRAAGGEELTGREDDLLGWWRFDQGRGHAVDDRTPLGNRAQLGDGRRETRPKWVLRSLHVGPGRYYVDGVACANEEKVHFARQPDLPGAALPPLGSPSVCLFYLDVWERSITATEDPDLLEVALGGADTTTRAKTVAQVKAVLVESAGEPDGEDLRETVHTLAEWQDLLAREGARGALKARRRPGAVETLGNLLYRVEIHDGGWVYGGPRPGDGPGAGTKVERITRAGDVTSIVPEEPAGLRAGQWAEIFDAAGGGAAGVLAQVRTVEEDKRTLTVAEDLGALAGGRDVRLRPVATLKWSRSNGATAWPTLAVEGGSRSVRLKDLGRDDLDLREGDWVELVDDASVLQGQPEPLLKVDSVNPASRQVALTTALSGRVGRNAALHPLLLRWDSDRASGNRMSGAVPLGPPGWLALEAGIEVEADGSGFYRGGDHWWLPVRSATGGVEWPADASGPVPRPPDGTLHRYAPLALLVSGEEGLEVVDCRKSFQPVTTGAVSKAGDTVDGSLRVRGDVSAEGAMSATVLYGSLGTPGSVGTDALAGGAVTPDKLAGEIATLPPGASILTGSAVAPPGFFSTGFSMTLTNAAPVWSVRREIPRTPDGRLEGAVAWGRIYVVQASGELWEFDPGTGVWQTRRPCPEARQGFALASVGEKIYLIGGLDPQNRPSESLFEYDPATDRWTGKAPMPTPRWRLSTGVWGGTLFALGGLRHRERVVDVNEAYDPSADTWTVRRSMPGPRHSFGAAVLGDRLYAVGGEGRGLFGLGRMISVHNFCYHAATDRWEHNRASLTSPRSGHAVAVAAGRLFVIGGREAFGETGSVESFDPAANLWTGGTPLPQPTAVAAAVGLEGTLYVIGGKVSPEARSVLVQACPIAATFWVHRRQ
jgi:hypothetical protein